MGLSYVSFDDDDDLNAYELRQQGQASNQLGKPTDLKKIKEEPGFFDGSSTAIQRGAKAGIGKIAVSLLGSEEDNLEAAKNNKLQQQLYEIAKKKGEIPKTTTLEQYTSQSYKKNKKETMQFIKDNSPNEHDGTGAQIFNSLGDYGVRGAVGRNAAGAAFVVGTSTHDYTYNKLIDLGVDERTASLASMNDGLVDAVSMAIPVYRGKGLIKNTGLIAAPVAVSEGGRAINHAVLQDKGYSNQAKEYEFSTEGILTNIVLGGSINRGSAYLENRKIKADDSQDNLQNTAELSDDIATDLSKKINDEYESLGLPKDDVIASEKTKQNRNAVEHQILNKQPINIPHQDIPEPAIRKTVNIAPSEYKNIRYDDPRLDVVLRNKAHQMNMDWAVPFLLAVRRAGEKSHNNQVSPKGAQSIMQIMPDTKAGLEKNYKKKWDIDNPEHATEMALYLAREMSQQYKTKDPLVLAAHYNGGFANGKAMQKNGKPKAQETINYVNRVRDFINGNEHEKYNGDNLSTVHALDGSSYDVAYEIRSLNDLVVSNDINGAINSLYPPELQPRDRTREASRQQIESIANDLRPELLSESPMLSNGAPIIGRDNVVESGNGRTLALNLAHENGKADEYRSYIESYAREKGWDISNIDKPVLVRTRLTDTDRVQFTRLANESDVAQFSATERAKTDADRLPDASLLKINADGSINLDGSMDFIRGFVGQLPQSERADIFTPNGQLSQGGKRRIETAITHQTYDDPNLVTRLAENLDDDSKTVLNALLRVAPQLSQLGALVKQGGRHQNTIATDLAQAAQKLSDIKVNGQTVGDYLNQIQLLDDGLSDGAKAFLSVFDANKRSAKGIADNIQGEIDRIEGMGDPRQGSLFGDTPEQIAAIEILRNNPNMPVSAIFEDASGNQIEVKSAGNLLEKIEQDFEISRQEEMATSAAINCALQFGV